MIKEIISLLKWGWLLLTAIPIFLIAHPSGGLSLNEIITDNLYYQPVKTSGNLTALSGYLSVPGFCDFFGDGSLSFIATDPASLLLGMNTMLNKTVFLPGAGNKNSAFLFVGILYPTENILYRYFELKAGDSLGFYIKDRYRLKIETEYQHRQYASTLVRDFHRLENQSSLSFPLPYCFMIPGLTVGSTIFSGEQIYYGQPSINFQLPLRPELFFEVYGQAAFSETPDLVLPVDDSLTSDEFFREMNLHQSSEAGLTGHYAYFPSRFDFNFSLSGYKNWFFPNNLGERYDHGIRFEMNLRILTGKNSVFLLGYNFRMNRSSLDNHAFTYNGIRVNLEFSW